MNLFEDIAQLANLNYDDSVSICESPELKRKALQAVIDAGLCRDRKWLFEMYPETKNMNLWFGEREDHPGEHKFLRDVSIFDTLGEYSSARKEITIFTRMCSITAKSLRIDLNSLKSIVRAHEVAHAVTHLGRDNQGRIWDHFGAATSEDKELFAQLYALRYFEIAGDKLAVNRFKRLSDRQDSRYNSWRIYDGATLALINRDLLDARMKRPTPTIPGTGKQSHDESNERIPAIDTIVVPAQEEGFRLVFLGEHRWWPVRMARRMTRLGAIKYIAVYQVAPISAVTHWALIRNILPWEVPGKFVINFAEPAWKIRPICLVKGGGVTAPRAPRYTSFKKLQKAITLDDLF